MHFNYLVNDTVGGLYIPFRHMWPRRTVDFGCFVFFEEYQHFHELTQIEMWCQNNSEQVEGKMDIVINPQNSKGPLIKVQYPKRGYDPFNQILKWCIYQAKVSFCINDVWNWLIPCIMIFVKKKSCNSWVSFFSKNQWWLWLSKRYANGMSNCRFTFNNNKSVLNKTHFSIIC